MSSERKSIFREEALRQYFERREKPVILMLPAPHTAIYLWTAFGAVLACAALAYVTKAPAYADALAFETTIAEEEFGGHKVAIMAVLLKPETVSQVRIGQRVFFRLAKDRPRLSGTISARTNVNLPPEQVRRCSGQIPSAMLKQQVPVNVALVILDRKALSAAFPTPEQTCIEAQIELAAH